MDSTVKTIRRLQEALIDLQILLLKVRVCSREFRATNDWKYQDAIDRILDRGVRLVQEMGHVDERQILRVSDLENIWTVAS